MKKLLILTMAFALSACANYNLNKDEIKSRLIGKWLDKESSDKSAFIFIRSNKAPENVKRLHFHEDGSLELYFPFGCQLPPHFKTSFAEWRLISRNQIEIDHHFPGEEPERWKIVKLSSREFRFIFD